MLAVIAGLSVAGGVRPAAAAPPTPAPAVDTGMPAGTPAPREPDRAQRTDLPRLDDGYGATAAEQAAMAAAADQARRTGKAVPVGALTTETQAVVARPGGGFEVAANPRPVRTTQRGRWVPVDLTLRSNADGTLSPAATAYGTVTFSGGGSGPLASTVSGSSRFAVSWPAALPKPVVAGSTATYAEVLPGVDLVVAATVAGGFSEVLVVRSAAAARNPRLANLTLGVRTAGGGLTATRDGGLRAGNPSARTVLTASRPLMWDSTTDVGVPLPADAAPDPSTAAHPGQAARLAPVRVATTADTLSLVPDLALLTGKSTKYPVYLDPTFNWHPTTGGTPAFDEVKQGSPCNGTSFYNNAGAAGDFGRLGVGVNHWTSCIGIMHAYYQWNLPHLIWGAHINSATVNATEVYSASCSATATVNLHWTGAIGPGTSWNNRPGYVNGFNVGVSYGPSANPSLCPNNDPVTHGFNVLGPVAKDAAGHAAQFTVALAEDANESNGDAVLGFKRFADNPTLQIMFNRAPAVPSRLAAYTRANNAGCKTPAPYPYVGATIHNDRTTMSARVTDPDADHLTATFKYWIGGSPTSATVPSAPNLASGATATAQLPETFSQALTNGQVVSWQVRVTDGADTSAWSPICRFVAQPTAPSQPAITSTDYPDADNGGGFGPAAGTLASFTLTNNGTAATKFVYGVDLAPPVTNPPASQTVPAANNTATIQTKAPAGGLHTLWVASIDAAGDPSSLAAYRFVARGHAATSCASLAACVNNTAISADSAMGSGHADGTASYSANDLAAAGWTSGSTVTVNGAALTLPAFGAGQPDNVLAANQTVAFNRPIPGVGGTALTFLVAATGAAGKSPGAIDGNTTAPYVPADTDVASSTCFEGTDAYEPCTPHGVITFADGTQQPYDLVVPDWITGPYALAAVTLPHLNTPGGQQAGQPKLNVFSVPLRPDEAGKAIASVTLPDVSDQVNAEVGGLHIFAMTTRNTTTTTAPVPAGQTWTGGWAAPTEGAYNFEAGADYQNMTFRLAVKPSISGGSVRIKLDNALGHSRLVISHATIAAGGTTQSAVPSGPIQNLRFGGAAGTTIPMGAMVYSDALPLSVTAGRYLLVSFTLADAVTYIPEHSWASGVFEWITAPGAGDHAGDTTAAAFTGAGTIAGVFSDILTEVDVATGQVPTQAVLGDGLIDVGQPNVTPSASGVRLSDILASTEPTAPLPYGTVATGIHSNQILVDFPQAINSGARQVGGPSALSRIDRDVLAQPGLHTVVLMEGLEDVLNGVSAEDLDGTGFSQVLTYLRANNVDVVVIGLPPCGGYAGSGGATTNDPCTTDVEDARTTVNGWLSGEPLGAGPWSVPALFYVDADAALGVPAPATGQLALHPSAARADKVNLTDAGYAALASAYLGPVDTWSLDDGNTDPQSREAADTASNDLNPVLLPGTTGQHPAALFGGATWTSDPTRGAVLALDGTSGSASTAGPVLDTSASYSISAWVRLTSTAHGAIVATQEGVNVPAVTLAYSSISGSWVAGAAASDAPGPAFVAHGVGAPALNTWTQLVVTHDANTHTLALFVNGVLQQSVGMPSPWAASGGFELGHEAVGNWFPGQLSNVQAWNYRLTPTQIVALYQQVH
jgi:hypothetical protein